MQYKSVTTFVSSSYCVFRFAYAIVDDEEDDEVPVQGPNENFGKEFMCIQSQPLQTAKFMIYGLDK